MVEIAPKRILSIDALRGFDMMWIMGFGQTLRKVGEIAGTDWGSALAYQMTHVFWAGLHLHDLIFPTFVFLAGASWPFSLEKHRAKGMTDGQIFFRHVLRRFVLLFCLGLITSGILGFNFMHLLYMSVLGRIACAWFVAATTLLFLKPRKTIVVAALMIFGYWLALRFLPGLIVPGCDPWSTRTNLIVTVDRWVFGDHIRVFGVEGFLSAFIGAPGCAFLGIISGLMLKREDWSATRKSVMLGAFSIALSAAAVAVSTVCPCVKNILWSPTVHPHHRRDRDRVALAVPLVHRREGLGGLEPVLPGDRHECYNHLRSQVFCGLQNHVAAASVGYAQDGAVGVARASHTCRCVHHLLAAPFLPVQEEDIPQGLILKMRQ